MLHLAACAAIVASGAIALNGQPEPLARRAAPSSPPDLALAPLDGDAANQPDPELSDSSALLDAPDPSPSDSSGGLAAGQPAIQTRSYVVQPGDTVRSIAQQFGVSNETIIWENDLTDPDFVVSGQTLEILPFTGLIHSVRPGDTVASIANVYEAKLQDVIQVNRLEDPFIILVGQKLAVPGGYRPLPQKPAPLVPAPAAAADAPPADTVKPGPSEDQQAAANVAPPRQLPQLGNTPQERFIASIAEAAVESMDRTGVPASVTIAQAILESYWGSSRLAQEANNYFGIKAQTQPGPAGVLWLDVWEVIGGRNVIEHQPFRAYHSLLESFVDHGRFFEQNGRYASAMAARGDPRQFAREINRDGYATDPGYAAKLIALMDRYNLYQFDG